MRDAIISNKPCQRNEAPNKIVISLFLLLRCASAGSQSLSVLPVNIFLQPGQSATSLTVTNQGTSDTAIQIRSYAWSQKDGEDQIESSDALAISPPIAKIAKGASQVVRLILLHEPQGHEATYRIWVDQIPPPTEPGIVNIVLRLSIPIFAEPTTRVAPHVQFHIESDAGQIYLVGINDGLRHDALRDIELYTDIGTKLTTDPGVSPYILAGSRRRWRIAMNGSQLLPNETLRLTTRGESGFIEEHVSFVSKP